MSADENLPEIDTAVPEVHYPPSRKRRVRIIPSSSNKSHHDRHQSIRLVYQTKSSESKSQSVALYNMKLSLLHS